MQPILNKLTLALFFIATIVSCSKDKEEEAKGNITTSAVTEISYNSAKSGGIILESSSAIEQRGICYSTTPNPDISSTITKGGNSIGSFPSNMSPLMANTKYYVRAYMWNASGIFYGNEVEFTTLNYPTENIWKLNENIYVINNQNIIGQFKWRVQDSSFAGGDVSVSSEPSAISVKFNVKPTASKTYKLVNKSEDLAEDECSIEIISAKSPYIGTYKFLSAIPQSIQVSIVNNKTKITIPTVAMYEENDVVLLNPINFNAILIEN